jgi:hypothetical protein
MRIPIAFLPILFASLPLLAADPAAPADASAPDTSAPVPADTAALTANPPETCKELIRRIRTSDCARPVSRWLDGASVVAGLTLSVSGMEITVNDDPLATMVGVVSPSPYFSVSSPSRYFWSTSIGWETSVSYTSSMAIYQDLRPESGKVKDLGTYASLSFFSVSPSLFAAIGAGDRTPDIWWRAGLGVGAGWASVRGSAYFTQDTVDAENRACYDAASALMEGRGTKADLRSACVIQTYSEKGFGLSTRAFTEARFRFLYGSISAGGLIIESDTHEFFPMEIAVRFAYIHDL